METVISRNAHGAWKFRFLLMVGCKWASLELKLTPFAAEMTALGNDWRLNCFHEICKMGWKFGWVRTSPENRNWLTLGYGKPSMSKVKWFAVLIVEKVSQSAWSKSQLRKCPYVQSSNPVYNEIKELNKRVKDGKCKLNPRLDIVKAVDESFQRGYVTFPGNEKIIDVQYTSCTLQACE